MGYKQRNMVRQRGPWVGEGGEPLSLSLGSLGLFVSRLHVREAVIVGLQMFLRIG